MTVQVPAIPATRHRCPARRSIALCRLTTPGRPTRRSCPGCGTGFLVEQGYYGVFEYNPDGGGHYRPVDARCGRLFRSEDMARTFTDGTELVVRWVSLNDVVDARARGEIR